jgi:two-component system, chemotaxis family, CheB/CheR fusion protein
MAARFSIVGIGASAGGVEALEAFFAAMPAESGMAFVVVTHLDPKRESWLAEIIGRRTTMPVAAARDGDKVAPQHVYVMPPGMVMTIEWGHLRLREADADHHERAPIDVFFTSLAEDQGEDAVGIVLSGGGRDGTLGITAIKEHGGLTLAQGSNSTEPRFKDMPENAAATGLVDLVVPVEQMPERLLSYHLSASEVESDHIGAATKTICALLRTRLGHDFGQYKDKTFGRRVQRRMQVLELTDIDAYVDKLKLDSDEITLLFRDLLIGVTSFFRDGDAFRALATRVIPEIFDAKRSDHEVRVWVPGCSTGEEVYSLAILLREHLEKLQSQPKVLLFATDIDDRAMIVARAGQYPASLLTEVSPERLEKFFVAEGPSYRVKKELRDMCIFSPHSVIRDPPFSRLDLISCRNLLIYLKVELQARLYPVFHYALRRDGFLFLGLSETIARHDDLFAPLDKEHRIFKRRDLVSPLSNSILQFTPQSRAVSTSARLPREPGASNTDLLRSAVTTVVERFAPAHVVVNEAAEVLHYSIRTGKYLEPAFGAPTRDLFAMARKELRADLRVALRKAVETRRGVTNDHVAVDIDGGVQAISLTVQPIIEGGDAAFLIVFIDIGPTRPQDELVVDSSLPVGGDAAIQQLEQELQESKQRLQATIEELDTSNEELKSSNEELLSVNEELQSSNEELEASREETQSINEELQTVNAELHHKLIDLDQSNSDLRNVFESTQIGTIFLDRDLVIQSFTPAVNGIYSLVPSDRGRPLTDLVSRLDGDTVVADTRKVFEQEQPVERRVSANQGDAHYLMRILPYYATNHRIVGVLVTFTDIASIIASEKRQKAMTAELSHRVKNTLAVVASIATQTGLRARTVEDFLEAFLGRLHGLASTHDLLSQSEWTDAPLRRLIEFELAPYAEIDGGRLEVSGPPISLTPRAAVTFGMVIHELATNSVKFGALSVPEGRLQVSWSAEHRGPAQKLELRWFESNGPAIAGTVKRGFGTEFIERAARFELDGEAKIALEKGGLRCTMTVPVNAEIIASSPDTPVGADHGVA